MSVAWLRGVFAPIPTAFDGEGRLNGVPARFLEHLAAGGLRGVVALGSNGEAEHLTDSERIDWLKALRARLPKGLRLIAGTGAQSTAATLERTLAAADCGAEAALVITPSYYGRDLTSEALRRHYERLAERAPVPLLIYNVPGHTGMDLPTATLALMTQHPNLVGIKDSSSKLSRLPVLRARMPPGFIILTGRGERLAESMALGADGAIAALANLAPRECAQVWQFMDRRDQAAATAAQSRIKAVGEALSERFGVPGVKAGVRIQGFDHGPPRAPLPALSPADEAALRGLLESAGLLAEAVAR
jgi:4-hydroxy-2-oxoglutarate aldolase